MYLLFVIKSLEPVNALPSYSNNVTEPQLPKQNVMFLIDFFIHLFFIH